MSFGEDDGTKWSFLEHNGPLFAPGYDPMPSSVRFYYDGSKMSLSEPTEEVATFYGKMLDHDYTTKEVFNKNFFKDWRKVMTEKEKEKIRDLSKCDFSEINEYFKKVSEERKNRSKEEKQRTTCSSVRVEWKMKSSSWWKVIPLPTCKPNVTNDHYFEVVIVIYCLLFYLYMCTEHCAVW